MAESMATIRARVMAVYDFKAGWVSRVNGMPDHQVYAIYRRFAENNFDPQRIKKDGICSRTTEKLVLKALSHEPMPEPTTTGYMCNDCHGYFEADNPELIECRFCGSTNIMRGV